MDLLERPNLVLTGFMGTGKSTVGRQLATRLGYEFADTDEVISSVHGPIPAIFEQRGEAVFRQLERETAADLADRRGLVISTGGRLLLDPENAARLSRHGRVFCLTATIRTLTARLERSAPDRPLLAGGDLATRLAELLREREAGYARFEQVSTDDRGPSLVIEDILRRWRNPRLMTQLLLPTDDLGASTQHFETSLGFGLEALSPSHHPTTAVMKRDAVRVVLTSTGDVAKVASGDPLPRPQSLKSEQAPDVAPLRDNPGERIGRDGLVYRHLIARSDTSRFIASRIEARPGVPVNDAVHFHNVRFQMIYCLRGWVRIAYEDQGEPITVRSGDFVLQPPHIRHRVLESSDDMQLLELASPADHMMAIDRELALPTSLVRPNRDFNGQRFVFRPAASAEWQPWGETAFVAHDSGFAEATAGLARVSIVRVPDGGSVRAASCATHQSDVMFVYVLGGSVAAEIAGDVVSLQPSEAVTVPAGTVWSLTAGGPDLHLLVVELRDDATRAVAPA